MLKLENIVKDYEVAGKPFPALKGVSLSFRDSEFVSILGPSGSGKTTLLNIIGGLDHYTSGDLEIDGASTKGFSDRDWDNYRNHKVGFIFQSYNLIPHQNVLENVELALTISGVKKAERRKRAEEALRKVGLGEMLYKKPNQLSGGQCQRVAIARALVNDPSILLADEPTGALDTKTSIQIMDLLKEVAKDRLVIMVTHNPELAEKYSSRIVSLKDGLIVQDSCPPKDEEEGKLAEIPSKKAKLSLSQSFYLSFRNLFSKAKRTAMVCFAGSIGIVGVSLVLAISSGISGYIASMQDDMLSGNPVSISSSTLDIESLMASASTSTKTSIVSSAVKEGKINVDFVIEELIKTSKTTSSSLVSNSISQAYVDFLRAMPEEYYNAISYSFGIAPENNLYTNVTIDVADGDGYKQDKQIRSLSFMEQFATSIVRQTEYSSYADLISSYGSALSQGLSEKSYVLGQYDLVDGGKFAEKEDEMMLVLNGHDAITDFVLTELGYYSQDQFLSAIDKFSKDADPDYPYDYDKDLFKDVFSMEEIKAKDFYYYPNDVVFTPNEAVKSYLDEDKIPNKSDLTRPFTYESERQVERWGEGMKMKIVGILTPKDGVQYGCLSSGLYYTPAFMAKFRSDNKASYLSRLLTNYSSLSGVDSISTSLAKDPTTGAISGSGLYYSFSYYLKWHEFDKAVDDYGIVGRSSSMSTLMNAFASSMGIAMGSGRSASLTLANAGGSELPSSIRIYPIDFDSKYLVTDYLDQWNAEGDVKALSASGSVYYLTEADRSGNPIKYSDNLQVVISMINTILNIVTYALVAFTALSLVVSTVMIAIITYVSVIERIKEIGVIRSLGGRKRDVANLFMAETVMVGLSSGALGIGLTYLLSLVVNLIVGAFTGVYTIASLPWYEALIMIAVSVLLTSISGVVPAMSAARKDPVNALRSE